MEPSVARLGHLLAARDLFFVVFRPLALERPAVVSVSWSVMLWIDFDNGTLK